MNDTTNVFKYILRAFYVVLNEFIKTFIDFSKHMGDPGINSGLTTPENSFDELREYILVARRFYGTGVCHVPVPVVEIKFSIKEDT